MELFKQRKEVKARHILFQVKEGASEEEEAKIKGKALIVTQQARAGKDFAKLAETYSQGPTAKEGGDLGYFSKGQMVKPFEEAAFKMEVGEISDPVRSPFGFHIIKVEDIKEARMKLLDEVRSEIRDTLIKTASMDLAHAKALSLMDQMPYDVDLKEYAESQDMAIKESPFFSQEEGIPDIVGDEKLKKTLFSLQEKSISDLIEFDHRFFIIQVLEKKASHLPELKEVEADVREDFISHLSLQEAKSAAEAYLTQLKDGEDWDHLAKKNNLKIETTDFFSRGRPVPPISYSPDLQEAAFGLSQDRPYPDLVFEDNDGILVVRWEGEKGIDQEQYLKDKEQIRLVLMRSRHQGFFGNWLASLKARAEIELINPPEKT
jgi:peptidyl-prolyl cis-trans isomerase D